jgi:signal transduction histidine kinase
MDESATTRPGRKGRSLSSLRVRLALAIATSVLVTGFGASWLALQLARQALAAEVAGIAQQAARRAADQLQGLPAAATPDEITARLRSVDESVPEVQTLAYLLPADGTMTVRALSGSPPTALGLGLAANALRADGAVTSTDRGEIRVAVPVRRDGSSLGVVLLRADLAGAIRLQQRALGAIVGFGALAVIALVVVVDLLAWPMVHRPVQQLRDTIARVSAGDFSARVPNTRQDELGDVATGLNEMLARLEDLNSSLQTRIREATSEVQQRNQQLVETYHRVFGLREQLASAEQLASVGQTAANVAHQVGTPLNLISGYVQLLKEELGPGSPHVPRLAIIEEQIAKVTSTVRTLLDRSRQMGRKTRTTAGALVGRICEVMKPNLDAAGIRLEFETPSIDPPILVDATNLELALLNLMTNAVDAMPKGGLLRVAVADASPNRVKIEIADTGHGIPEELQQRIFEPWVSTKKPGRGTGLGLAIARDVVSAHGGTISVMSSVGQGTTFTIDLPSDAGRDSATAIPAAVS